MKKILLALSALFAFSGLVLAVDINTADQKELESVKGIGPAKAKAIIDYRKQNGPFKSVDDLANVKGMDKKGIARMKGELSAGEGKKMDSAKKDPVEAGKNADETMPKSARRPPPGQDPKPGPVKKSAPASSEKADETMTKPSPRQPAAAPARTQ